MKIKVKKSVLQQFIRKAMDEGWTGDEAVPTVINEPPMEMEPVVIQPSTETQVADSNLPVEDRKWQPGNSIQLGMAMKQLAEMIPDGQIGYFWPRVKVLVKKAQENAEGEQVMPEEQPEPEAEERITVGY